MRSFGVLLVLILAGISKAATPNAPLILISIDGFRWDYLELQSAAHLIEIAKAGVRAKKLEPVFPSVTFPNHYSIATGLYSENHGIVANQMFDAIDSTHFTLSDSNIVGQSKWWQGEPIWVTAEKQGVKAATMFWVGSEAEIKGIRPTYWMKYDEKLPLNDRIEKILEWVDLPAEKRPGFITLYFEMVDSAGHRAGPNSEEVKDAILKVDESIGKLKQGLKDRGVWESAHIMIVSDHGMAEVTPEHHVVLPEIKEMAEVIGKGAFLQIWPKQNHTKKVLKKLAGLKHVTLYEKNRIPKRFRYQKHGRIAPIILVPFEGWYLDTENTKHSQKIGAHGYDNQLDSMQGILIAHGPLFKKNTVIERVKNIDLYEAMCHILGLKPSLNDGNYKRILPMFEPLLPLKRSP